MTLQVFLSGLLLVSILTGLVTEAIKTIFEEQKKKYYSNTIAGVVAVILAVLVDLGYTVLNGVVFNASWIVCLVALIGLSWLCAMVGYDKVIQALSQIRSK